MKYCVMICSVQLHVCITIHFVEFFLHLLISTRLLIFVRQPVSRNSTQHRYCYDLSFISLVVVVAFAFTKNIQLNEYEIGSITEIHLKSRGPTIFRIYFVVFTFNSTRTHFLFFFYRQHVCVYVSVYIFFSSLLLLLLLYTTTRKYYNRLYSHGPFFIRTQQKKMFKIVFIFTHKN